MTGAPQRAIRRLRMLLRRKRGTVRHGWAW